MIAEPGEIYDTPLNPNARKMAQSFGLIPPDPRRVRRAKPKRTQDPDLWPDRLVTRDEARRRRSATKRQRAARKKGRRR